MTRSGPSATAGGAGPIEAYLEADHARLEALLSRAVAAPGAVDLEPYAAFRAGLLRHIALEEKLLLPAAREVRGGAPLPEARRLRIEHGAIAALLVPPPTPALVEELRSILGPHNALEDAPGGVYCRCEALLGERAGELLARMHAYPPVKVARFNDGPRAVRTAAEALRISERQFDAR